MKFIQCGLNRGDYTARFIMYKNGEGGRDRITEGWDSYFSICERFINTKTKSFQTFKLEIIL